MRKVLEVKDLRTEFSLRNRTVQAVNGVSYDLYEKETLAIVGESGSGKSVGVMSVMRLINTPPGEIVGGEVLLNGKDLLKLTEREMEDIRGNDMAMIFQDPMTSLNPIMTIGKQLGEAVARHTDLNKEQIRARVIELLELVGIPSAEDRLDSYPIQFSGGMRQRVMIALGLSCNPKVLIADEPTTALDVTIQAQITDLVARLQSEMGMSVVWITHDLGVVAGIADRVLVMYAGRVVEEAEVNDLFYKPRHPYTEGLLNSVPTVDGDRPDKLESIDGIPPDLSKLPKGCPFYDRCTYRMDKCKNEAPQLESVGDNHRAACFVDISKTSKRYAERAKAMAAVGDET